jgi:hypothetical protein
MPADTAWRRCKSHGGRAERNNPTQRIARFPPDTYDIKSGPKKKSNFAILVFCAGALAGSDSSFLIDSELLSGPAS